MTDPLFASPDEIPLALLESPEYRQQIDQFTRSYFTFQPRPDQPERYDQQASFLESKTCGVKLLLGGNGCLGAEQPIFDPVAGIERRVGEIDEPFHVWTRNPETGNAEIGLASRPWVKGRTALYRFTLDTGESFVATLEHRVLSSAGEWQPLRQLLEAAGATVVESPDVSSPWLLPPRSGAPRQSIGTRRANPRSDRATGPRKRTIAASVRPATIPAIGVPVPFSPRGRQRPATPVLCPASSRKRGPLGTRTVRGSQAGCPECRRSCGGRPPSAATVARSSVPSRGGAHGHSLRRSRRDAPATSRGYIRACRLCGHLARSNSAPLVPPVHGAGRRLASSPYLRSSGRVGTHARSSHASTVAIPRNRGGRRLPVGSCRPHTSPACRRSAKESPASYPQILIWGERAATIIAVRFLRVDDFYDLTVYPHHNYLASGAWHHNSGTTTTCVRSMCQFLMETPPPRKNTPFWVIGPDLTTTMETVWGEKLDALGHLPPSEIDWDRIVWWQPRKNLPFSVPLREWEGRPGKNWVIEFKAWKQGRTAFQARAIGGFLFLEQFPYELLVETLARCREYSFPGSKLVEFTPIDPNIGPELLEKIEDDTLPPTWEIRYLNTECAVEAGNVTREWYDNFYATVPESMRATRIMGRLPKWQGLIYPGFNRAIHLVGDDVIDFPPNVYYRRSIDWGAGPDNAFVCLWMYRNGVGQWFVFDEYYSTADVTVIDHLKIVTDRWKWPERNPHYGTTYADPSGKGYFRIAHRLPEYAPGYKRIPMTAASNAVLPGIECVQWHLQLDPRLATPEHPAGQPRLFIHKENCPNLARELAKYKWQTGSDGANPRDARVEPVKKDDHAVDACRYALFTERQLSVEKPVAKNDREDRAIAARRGVRYDRKEKPHAYGRSQGRKRKTKA